MTRLSRWWQGLFDEEGSVRAVALVRLLFGPIVVFHLWDFLTDALRGSTYQDRFHEPFWPWMPNPPEAVYTLLISIGVLAGVAMTVGLASRVATTTAFVVVGYNLLLDQTSFQHNRAFLLMNLGLLALQRTDRALSIDAWRYRRRFGHPPSDMALIWPLWLHRILLASVYLASSVSKLLDPDWRTGLVIWDRVVRFQHAIVDLPFGDTLADVLTTRGLYYWFSPLTLATELFIGLGLWHRRTRLAAVWVAVVFHVSIELTANVHTFSYAALAALSVWAVPRTGDRVVTLPRREQATAIRRLDWLRRFRVVVDEDGGPAELIEHDGIRHVGADARRRILLRLPLTFFVVAPVVAIHAARVAREADEPLPTSRVDSGH